MKTKTEKCAKCNKARYYYMNGIPLCAEHIITIYYSKNKECMESFLDCLEHSTLRKEDIIFLKEVKKKYPYVVEMFPKLFKRK